MYVFRMYLFSRSINVHVPYHCFGAGRVVIDIVLDLVQRFHRAGLLCSVSVLFFQRSDDRFL